MKISYELFITIINDINQVIITRYNDIDVRNTSQDSKDSKIFNTEQDTVYMAQYYNLLTLDFFCNARIFSVEI